ncbi:MAG TPA: hypothetical protein VF042_14525 [Gemmatimonadaceae bacterium]
MIAGFALFLLLQAPPASAPSTGIPVQLAVSVTADTVTVGQRFNLILRVRAPEGSTIEFPTTVDSASSSSITGMELIGKPAILTLPGTGANMMSAAYRLSMWDVGEQRIALPDIAVKYNGQTGYVSLADRHVFVRSVLPEDSAQRVPKPARPAIESVPFNWLPWVTALATVLAALGLWRLWIWYRRRRSAPLDPYAAAQREFARIEAMNLVAAGEGDRYAAMMSDVMRAYLARRVPEIERSHTSSELIAASGRIHSVASGLGELLWKTDLIKFAHATVAPDEATQLGRSSRDIVESVENHLTAEEERASEAKAA